MQAVRLAENRHTVRSKLKVQSDDEATTVVLVQRRLRYVQSQNPPRPTTNIEITHLIIHYFTPSA